MAQSATARAQTGSPQRIVSLNPCLDAILVRVADRRQIAAVSHYSRDPQSSSIADIARKLPITYESAEEIIALRPDLVLTSEHSGVATRTALARLGFPVAAFGVPNTVRASLDQITEIARRVGNPAGGAALVAAIRTALEAVRPPAGRPAIRALVFQARGLVAGRETLVGEVMAGAGFENVGARYGIASWGTLSLERLLADPPDMLLAGEATPGARTYAERVLAHPALARIGARMQIATFPPASLYCGGPVLIETARALARARTAHDAAA
jgi:iron complex transport system substrate-binding protein